MARINEHPNVVAFLDMLAWSEGTIGKGDDGYNDIVDPAGFFTDYSTHPNLLVQVNSKIKSTAAGRYQLLARYFEHYKKLLGLKDFSPLSQDKIAIQQIKERKAYQLIIAGQITEAISRCSNIWASLPGNSYGQRQHKVADLIRIYQRFGGISQ
jgi:muramidase (phage lysozyme)